MLQIFTYTESSILCINRQKYRTFNNLSIGDHPTPCIFNSKEVLISDIVAFHGFLPNHTEVGHFIYGEHKYWNILNVKNSNTQAIPPILSF